MCWQEACINTSVCTRCAHGVSEPLIKPVSSSCSCGLKAGFWGGKTDAQAAASRLYSQQSPLCGLQMWSSLCRGSEVPLKDFNLWRWVSANWKTCLHFPRKGGTPCHARPLGKHQSWSGGTKEQDRSVGSSFIWCYRRKGKVWQVNHLGLSSLINVSGLWAEGKASRCLTLRRLRRGK